MTQILRGMNPKGVKGTFINQETFDHIRDEICDWYDKNIERWVHNIQQIYALTGNDCSYSCLNADWDFRRNWAGVGDIVRFSAEEIRKNILDKIYCPLNWLYVCNDYGQNPMKFNEGFTGLLVTFRLIVEKTDTWHYSYNLSIDIGCGESNSTKEKS